MPERDSKSTSSEISPIRSERLVFHSWIAPRRHILYTPFNHDIPGGTKFRGQTSPSLGVFGILFTMRLQIFQGLNRRYPFRSPHGRAVPNANIHSPDCRTNVFFRKKGDAPSKWLYLQTAVT